MDVYHLMPTSCYNEDSYDNIGGRGDDWMFRQSPDIDDDGRSGANVFHDHELSGCGGSDETETGWYNVVDQTARCSSFIPVPPVPHLLAFDPEVGRQYFRYLDDDCSEDNDDTLFGRTLDTISEEDEDENDVMRAAEAGDETLQDECSAGATASTQRLIAEEFDGTSSGTPCSSPMHVVSRSQLACDLPPLWQRDTDSFFYRDSTTCNAFSPDNITRDWITLPEVLRDPLQTRFYVDDCRFGDRLASFRDNSIDYDEQNLTSFSPECRRSSPQDPGVGDIAADNVKRTTAKDIQPVNTAVTCPLALAADMVDAVDNSVFNSDALDDSKSRNSASIIGQLRGASLSTADAEFALPSCWQTFDASIQPTNFSDSPIPESIHADAWCPVLQAPAVSEPTLTFQVEVAEDNAIIAETLEFEGEADSTVKANCSQVINSDHCLSYDCSVSVDVKSSTTSSDAADKAADNDVYYSCEEEWGTGDGDTNILNRQNSHNGHVHSRSTSLCDREETEYASLIEDLPEQSKDKTAVLLVQSALDGSGLEEIEGKQAGARTSDASVQVDFTAISLPPDLPSNNHVKSMTVDSTNCTMASCVCDNFQPKNEINNCQNIDTGNAMETAGDDIVREISVSEDPECKQDNGKVTSDSADLVLTENKGSKYEVIVRSTSHSSPTTNDSSIFFVESDTKTADTAESDHLSSSRETLSDQKRPTSTDVDDASLNTPMQRPELPHLANDLEKSNDASNSQISDNVTAKFDTAMTISKRESTDMPSSHRKLLDNGQQSSRTAESRGGSLVVVDIDIGESCPSTSAAPSNEHRRHLEAMKKQLRDARPIPPTPALSIDSEWNSTVARKLTPSARCRSAVWTPYDGIFSASTAGRRSDDRMWRTTSLQTLRGKFNTAPEFGHRQTGSTADLKPQGRADENTDDGEDSQQSEMMSFEKTRSLYDLRRRPEHEEEAPSSRRQLNEFGSVDDGMNSLEDKSPPSSATSPRRRLPSEEFIRRSLERLNLPDWFVSSSALLCKKIGDIDHILMSINPTSCSPADVVEPEKINSKLLSEGHVMQSTERNDSATSGLRLSCDCESSDDYLVSRFSTSSSLRESVNVPQHRWSAADPTLLSPDFVSNSLSESQSDRAISPTRKERHGRKRLAVKSDKPDRRINRCPHGKKYRSRIRCSECQHSMVNDYNNMPPESVSEMTSISPSKTPDERSPDNYNDPQSKQLISNHRTKRTKGTTKRRRSKVRHEPRAGSGSDTNEVTTTGVQIVENATSPGKNKIDTSTTVDENALNIILALERSPQRLKPSDDRATNYRSLRRRTLKPTTSSAEDVNACDDVSKDTKRNSSKRLLDTLVADSSENLTNAVPGTNDATETRSSSCDNSRQSAVENENRTAERKVNRRRRRQGQPSSSAGKLFQAADREETAFNTLSDGHMLEISDGQVSQPSHECSDVANTAVVPWEQYDTSEAGGRTSGGGSSGEGRRHRRQRVTANKQISSAGDRASKPTECAPSAKVCTERREAVAALNDPPTSVSHRRRRRRPRDDLQDLGRRETGYAPFQMQTSDGDFRSYVADSPPHEHTGSCSTRPRPDQHQRHYDLERTETENFGGSWPKSMTYSCRHGDIVPPSGSDGTSQHLPRGPRCFAVTGNSLSSRDSMRPEVVDVEPEQESTEKLCLSAAARRCRRVTKSSRSRSADRSRDENTSPSVDNSETGQTSSRRTASQPLSKPAGDGYQSCRTDPKHATSSGSRSNRKSSSDRSSASKSLENLSQQRRQPLCEPTKLTQLWRSLRAPSRCVSATSLPDSDAAVLVSSRDSISGSADVTVRCRNDGRCSAAATLADARSTFSTCRHCYVYYCTRKCRKVDRQRHLAAECTYSRQTEVCRDVVRRVRDAVDIRAALSRAASSSFRSRGHGCILLVFGGDSYCSAEWFISASALDDVMRELSWEYASIDDLETADSTDDEHAKVLINMCRSYDPKQEFVMDVALLVGSDVKRSTSGSNMVAVVRCSATLTPLKDCTGSLREASAMKNLSSITSASSQRPETLILTAVPGSELSENVDERRAREVCFANIQRRLSQRGVDLRRQFPDVYADLCRFVADGRSFPAVTLFPVDSATGCRFMCLIMPRAEPNVEWTV